MKSDMKVHKKAAALCYPEGFPAPFILCKGTGRLAERMTELAERFKVPVVFKPEAVEILSLQEAGTYIPPETYDIFAAIFAFLKEVETYAKN